MNLKSFFEELNRFNYDKLNPKTNQDIIKIRFCIASEYERFRAFLYKNNIKYTLKERIPFEDPEFTISLDKFSDFTPQLILTIGIPASGKSTYAKKLIGELKFEEINLDDLREQLSGNPHNMSFTKQALEIWHNKLESCLQLRQNVVVSDTNLIKEYRLPLIDKFKKEGFLVKYVIFHTPFGVCVERNRDRLWKVPYSVMLKMSLKMDKLMTQSELTELLKEPDEWEFNNWVV